MKENSPPGKRKRQRGTSEKRRRVLRNQGEKGKCKTQSFEKLMKIAREEGKKLKEVRNETRK